VLRHFSAMAAAGLRARPCARRAPRLGPGRTGSAALVRIAGLLRKVA
jgi:hypothetical protein